MRARCHSCRHRVHLACPLVRSEQSAHRSSRQAKHATVSSTITMRRASSLQAKVVTIVAGARARSGCGGDGGAEVEDVAPARPRITREGSLPRWFSSPEARTQAEPLEASNAHPAAPHCAQPQTTSSKRHEKHDIECPSSADRVRRSPRAAQSTMATPSPKNWRPQETILQRAHVERSHLQTVQQPTASRSRWAHSRRPGSAAEGGAHSTPTRPIIEPRCLSAAATSRRAGKTFPCRWKIVLSGSLS